MAEREDLANVIGQGFAREQRRREVGRKGCDDCGIRHYRRVAMIGTAAGVRRLCSECQFHREIAVRKEDNHD